MRAEFSQKSVIGNWGNKRTYIVHDVDFEKSVTSFTFNYNGKDVTIAEYFEIVYKLRVTDPRQPLFVIKMSQDYLYLPPEFTILDGVPDSVRKGAGMRDALQQTKLTPKEKMDRIQKQRDSLVTMKSIERWGIKIEPQPSALECTVLGAAQIFSDNQVIHINEQVLRRLPIQKPVDLLREEWVIVFQESRRGGGRRNRDIAQKVWQTFRDACGMLRMKVEEPAFIELEREDDP